MQIQSIEIEGLWSYRDPQSINIAGVPLIVGVGENGTGKSALLVHAVVAALYGRFQTNTIDESITTGASQGRVSLEFLLSDDRYRIGRVWPRVGSPTAGLWVMDEREKSGWRTVTENGVSEVTAYVTDLIGMDYNTSTMTWIAEQGQYGKFSGALPGKKFQLLSGIFGLDAYAPKAKAAQAAFKAADTLVTGLDGRISELLDSLEQVDADSDMTGFGAFDDKTLSGRAATANEEVDRVGLALAELNASDPKRQTVEARQALELVRVDRVNRLDTATAANSRAARQLDDARRRGAATRASAESRHASETTAASARTATARENAARVRAQALEALSLISAAQRELPELSDVVTGYREAAGDARDLAAEASADIAAARTVHGVSKAEWAKLKQDVADAEARIDTLRRSAGTAENVGGAEHASCFSCGQHLSSDDALALIASQERDIASINARQAIVKEEGGAATKAVANAEARRDQATSAARAADAAAIRAAADVSRAEALIATREGREDAADDADIAVTRAVNDEARIVKEADAALRATVDEATEAEAQDVAAADAEIKASATIIAETAHATAKEEALARDLAAAEALISDAAADVDVRRAALESERQGHRADALALGAELARRAEAAAVRAEQNKRLNSVRVERAAADHDRLIHGTLSKAYSPTGIPAMVLAGVVEELNDAVNVALERLSRGELAVQIRASRETSKGAVENKVYVYVETPTGVRAYESLSGGQKFRVDLAIRTGLAKAVARGTGTPIQTFILDEGWGSLDEKGILSTIDTLFRLAEDTNVITVSHIDTVRDAFPARVEVTSVGMSSVAEVIA